MKITFSFDVAEMRDVWYKTSFLLDQKQTANGLAQNRFDNYKKQPLTYKFPKNFKGKLYQKLIARHLNQKLQLLEKKVLILNVKWQMQCI